MRGLVVVVLVAVLAACGEKPTPDSVREKLPRLRSVALSSVERVPGAVEVTGACQDLPGQVFHLVSARVDDTEYAKRASAGDLRSYMETVASRLQSECTKKNIELLDAELVEMNKPQPPTGCSLADAQITALHFERANATPARTKSIDAEIKKLEKKMRDLACPPGR